MSDSQASVHDSTPLKPLFRLACIQCDTDAADGVEVIPPGWRDVQQVQTPEEAARTSEAAGDFSISPLDWYTHLGLCPNCDWDDRED